ncbi:hypothetical protein ACFLQV_01355 [Calditrichota bacterium]
MALFGEVVIEMGFITEQQLAEAMEQQKQGRAKLGQIMHRMGKLDSNHIDEIFTYQQSEAGKDKRFGDCAVAMGLITQEDLDEAVNYQTTSKGVLGDVLIELGFLTQEQRDAAIKAQIQGI